MLPKLTFWFEFASTYSALSAARIKALATKSGVDIVWRPFLLGPIFKSQGWDTSPFKIYAAKGRYMWRDLERRSLALGLPPIRRPTEFPQNGLLAACLALLGLRDGWGELFILAVYRRQFGDGLPIAQPEDLASILADLGLEPSLCFESIKTNQQIKDELRQNTEDAQSLGIFGAPSFTTDDNELFWGDDRLEAALDWAVAHPA